MLTCAYCGKDTRGVLLPETAPHTPDDPGYLTAPFCGQGCVSAYKRKQARA